MIIYVPAPLEAYTQKEKLPQVRIELSSGGHLQAECIGIDQVRILSLSSTDPMDFLNQDYQPGSIIKLEAGV